MSTVSEVYGGVVWGLQFRNRGRWTQGTEVPSRVLTGLCSCLSRIRPVPTCV